MTPTAATATILPGTEGETPEPGAHVGTITNTAHHYITTRHGSGEISRETARNLRYLLARFADTVGDLPVRKIRRKHIERYLTSRNISPSTKRVELSGLRTFFGWCTVRGFTRDDPTRGIKGPGRIHYQPRGLTTEQVSAVLAHTPDSRGKLVVLLAVQEGLRRGEIRTLTVDRIDWPDRLITVRGKGGHERTVPLSDETADAIRQYLTESPARGGAPLLRSRLHPGRPLSNDWIYKSVRLAMECAGVKLGAWDGRSTHALRHSTAQHMLANGAQLEDVQRMLGHQHPQTTLIYTRRYVAATRLREVASGRRYGAMQPSGIAVERG